ncbi:MAG TPA: response regulator transcription factor, partial [Thermosynechococcaceae cyanobacterium]
GYCLKGIAAVVLVLAIRSVSAGASWWDSSATAEIQAAFQIPAPDPTPQPEALGKALTRREKEILTLVAAGRSNQEIAEQLYIAPGTVRVHVHAILQKLEVRDRTQAAIVAFQKHLIATDA